MLEQTERVYLCNNFLNIGCSKGLLKVAGFCDFALGHIHKDVADLKNVI